jgi:hypothetical protein
MITESQSPVKEEKEKERKEEEEEIDKGKKEKLQVFFTLQNFTA